MAGKKSLVCGVGINDSNYRTIEYHYVNGKRKCKTKCPFFRVWSSMINRCYREKGRHLMPAYGGCTVCDDWLLFSNFKKWMENQDWDGNELDKDILKIGNRVYCPDFCVFVSSATNSFLAGTMKNNKDLPMGVCWHKRDQKYRAQCQNPFTNKNEYIGSYECKMQAHKAWRSRKHFFACKISDMQADERVAKALRTRFSLDGDCI